MWDGLAVPLKLELAIAGAAGSAESILGSDSDKATAKHANVVRFTVNGQEVDMLVRTAVVNGTLFLDLIAGQSIAELTTTVANMDLSALGGGNPNPKKDFIDAQAMVAAGGS